MVAVQSRQAALAIAHCLRTGCTPEAAGKRYGVSTRTVQRGLKEAKAARQPGRPTLRVVERAQDGQEPKEG